MTAWFSTRPTPLKLTCIGRVAIPFLFIRFVVFFKVNALENFIVPICKECTYFRRASLFCFIFNLYSSRKILRFYLRIGQENKQAQELFP